MKKAIVILALVATLGLAAGCDDYETFSVYGSGWGVPSFGFSDWFYEPAYTYDTYYVEEVYYDDCCYDDYYWYPW